MLLSGHVGCFLLGLVLGRTKSAHSARPWSLHNRLGVLDGTQGLITPERSVHLLILIYTRVIAATLYAHTAQWHYSTGLQQNCNTDACSTDLFWWRLKLLSLAVELLSEIALVIWPVLRPMQYLGHARLTHRLVVGLKLFSRLVPDIAQDNWKERQLVLAGAFVLRLILNKDDVEEYASQAGSVVFVSFLKHAWNLAHSTDSRHVDWPEEALRFLVMFCAGVLLHTGYMRLVSPCSVRSCALKRTRSVRKQSSRGSTNSTMNLGQDQERRSDMGTSDRLTPGNGDTLWTGFTHEATTAHSRAYQEPLTTHSSVDLSTSSTPFKRQLSPLTLPATQPTHSQTSRDERLPRLLVAQLVVVRVTGVGIFAAYTLMTWRYLVEIKHKHGWDAARQVASEVWPSAMLAPLATLAQASSLLILSFTPGFAARRRKVFSKMNFWLPFATRLLMLVLEPSGARAHGHVVISLNPSTFIFFALASIPMMSTWSGNLMMTATVGAALLALKASVLGLLPPLSPNPLHMATWLYQLGLLAYEHNAYITVTLASGLLHPLLAQLPQSQATSRTGGLPAQHRRKMSITEPIGDRRSKAQGAVDSAVQQSRESGRPMMPCHRSLRKAVSVLEQPVPEEPGGTSTALDTCSTATGHMLSSQASLDLMPLPASPEPVLISVQPTFSLGGEAAAKSISQLDADEQEASDDMNEPGDAWIGAISAPVPVVRQVDPAPLPNWWLCGLAHDAMDPQHSVPMNKKAAIRTSMSTRMLKKLMTFSSILDKQQGAFIATMDTMALAVMLPARIIFVVHDTRLLMSRVLREAKAQGQPMIHQAAFVDSLWPVLIHAGCSVFTAGMLLASIKMPRQFPKVRTLLWFIQLAINSSMQQMALHMTHQLSVAWGDASTSQAVATPAYISFPVLSLFGLSVYWPVLNLQLSMFKAAVLIRVLLTVVLACSFLLDRCLSEPQLLGITAVQLVLLMAGVYAVTQEAMCWLPRLANRSLAKGQLAETLGLTNTTNTKFTWLYRAFRTRLRTGRCWLVLTMVLLLSPLSQVISGSLLSNDSPPLRALQAGTQNVLQRLFSIGSSRNDSTTAPLFPAELLGPLILIIEAFVGFALLWSLDLIGSSEVSRANWYQAQLQTLQYLSEQRLDMLQLPALLEALQAHLSDMLHGSFAGLILLNQAHSSDKEQMPYTTARSATLSVIPEYMPLTLSDEEISFLAGLLLRSDGEAVKLIDLHTALQMNSSDSDTSSLATNFKRMHVVSFTLVPIMADGVVSGGLFALSPEPYAHDMHFVKSLKHMGGLLGSAMLLSQALENVRAADVIIQDVMPREVAQHLKLQAAAQLHSGEANSLSPMMKPTSLDKQNKFGWLVTSAPDTSPQPAGSPLRSRHRGSTGHVQVNEEARPEDLDEDTPHLRSGSSVGLSEISFRKSLNVDSPRVGVQQREAVRALQSTTSVSAPGLHKHDLMFGRAPGTSFEHTQSRRGSTSELDSGSGNHEMGRGVVYKQWHESTTVLFCDIVGYTAMSQELEPEQVMLLLHELFTKYDRLADNWGVYKVETIGDCYMACTNVIKPDAQHAQTLVGFAIDMVHAANSVANPLTGGRVSVRVGLHSGRVMSGIVGLHRSRYCLFGDTVNTASRMESTGVANHIQISEATYELLHNGERDSFAYRGEVPVKGKGIMRTYLLDPYTSQP